MHSLIQTPSADTSVRLAHERTSRGFIVGLAEGVEAKIWCREQLVREHRLGAGSPAGNQVWQVVCRLEDKLPLAIVVWAASALHLKDRDAWIGWDQRLRSSRLGLIVNNSRLLILEATRQPNLASQSLSAALRVLPLHWEAVHGFAPVLAEAFTDIESHAGTTYKVTNWTPLGLTKGQSRQRADFYVANERPKKLWVKELRPDARAVLCAAQLPSELQVAEITAPAFTSNPLTLGQTRSLREVFRLVPDPRRESHSFKVSSMLTLTCLGLLCGATSFSQLMRRIQATPQGLRKDIGLPCKRGTVFYRVPCYNALRNLLKRIDLHILGQLLGQWQQQHQGQLPRSLAVDGKDLGKELGYLISLVITGEEGESGTPVAMRTVGAGHELSAAQAIFADPQVHLTGAIVTADALHCQQESARLVVGRGSNYAFSLKDNQPSVCAEAQRLLEGAAPLLPPRRKKAMVALTHAS